MPKKDVTHDLGFMRAQLLDERLARLEEVARNRQRGLTVVLEDVHNPHNLGAVARTCDAFGVQTVCFTVQDENLFNPKKLGRVTATSASKWLDYRIFTRGIHDCMQTLKSENWVTMAAVISDRAIPVYDVDFRHFEKVALVFGNEQHGLSDDATREADMHISIPMYGMTQSFNVSVAAAIILAEGTRQRRLEPGRFLLNKAEVEELTETFIRRSYLTKMQHRFRVNPDEL